MESKRPTPLQWPYLSVLGLAFGLAMAGCSDVKTAEEVLSELDVHYGKRLTMRARFRSGARCSAEVDGEFQTYCKDCQYCRGPIVVETTLSSTTAKLDDWPMVLGGTWEGKPIRCSGPLSNLNCHPFKLGALYEVRGVLERHRPPRLLVEDFEEVSAP